MPARSISRQLAKRGLPSWGRPPECPRHRLCLATAEEQAGRPCLAEAKELRPRRAAAEHTGPGKEGGGA
eukprot:9567979-Alexandrium_andersonii.AAC.1